METSGHRAAAVAMAALTVLAIAGCSGAASSVDRAEAQVAAKEKAVTEAQADLAAASKTFCDASTTYIMSLDRYGDVLNDTAPTVGDVRQAGAELAAPREDAFNGAEAAVEAQQQLTVAEAELTEARAALEQAKAGPSGSPTATGTPQPTPPSTPTPLAPAASVERVKQAESEFADAQGAITDQTPLTDAAERFNSAAVALELSWLRLFVDAGCLPDEQTQQAQAAVSAYVAALQQDLADAGYYGGAVDGVYGPMTVAAVEELQKASGLPVTGTMDNATAEALQAELVALGGAAAEDALAATAAVQQTLKLAGFWGGPVDGVWTPALTEAVKAFQGELGVEPTGAVDAATISAFQKAITERQQPKSLPTPSSPPSSPGPSPTPSSSGKP